jgi:transcription-repair coupling factor (superfamily II helicase)
MVVVAEDESAREARRQDCNGDFGFGKTAVRFRAAHVVKKWTPESEAAAFAPLQLKPDPYNGLQ